MIRQYSAQMIVYGPHQNKNLCCEFVMMISVLIPICRSVCKQFLEAVNGAFSLYFFLHVQRMNKVSLMLFFEDILISHLNLGLPYRVVPKILWRKCYELILKSGFQQLKFLVSFNCKRLSRHELGLGKEI